MAALVISKLSDVGVMKVTVAELLYCRRSSRKELEAIKTTNPEEFDENATYKSDEIKKGTTIIEGYCTAEVTAVGDSTESGGVYKSLNEGSEVKVGWLLKDASNNRIIAKFNSEDEANDALEEFLEKHEDADVVVEQPLIDRMRVRQSRRSLKKRRISQTTTRYVRRSSGTD